LTSVTLRQARRYLLASELDQHTDILLADGGGNLDELVRDVQNSGW